MSLEDDLAGPLEQFLGQIDRLDLELSQTADPKQRKTLEYERALICREFAQVIGEIAPTDENRSSVERASFFVDDGTRSVQPCWRARGVIAKRYKSEAIEWMASYHRQWKDSAPHYRWDIEDILHCGGRIPPHAFGLHVEWTVEIERHGPTARHDRRRPSRAERRRRKALAAERHAENSAIEHNRN